MNIAIVDDSTVDCMLLSDTIKKYAKENSIQVHISKHESGLEFLENTHFYSLDVVFLDIYMDGMNGMEVAHRLRQQNQSCRIVFVTSSADYAIKSYEVRAFHYILKPYSFEDIAHVMELLDQSLQNSSRYIKVKEGREWCKIFLSDILYADYSNHYVRIHTENSIISTYMKFQEFEKKLLIYSEFLNCYRCIVINMNKVEKVDDLFFLMCNGEYIPINRKRAKEIKTHYVDYIFGVVEGGLQDGI